MCVRYGLVWVESKILGRPSEKMGRCGLVWVGMGGIGLLGNPQFVEQNQRHFDYASLRNVAQ